VGTSSPAKRAARREGDVEAIARRPAGEGRGKDKKRETKREREGNRAERRNREREVGMAGWPGRALFFFCILALCIVCRKKKQVLRKIFQAICFERCHLHLCEWVLETFLLTFFKKKICFERSHFFSCGLRAPLGVSKMIFSSCGGGTTCSSNLVFNSIFLSSFLLFFVCSRWDVEKRMTKLRISETERF
jgi:hypothetical protein